MLNHIIFFLLYGCGSQRVPNGHSGQRVLFWTHSLLLFTVCLTVACKACSSGKVSDKDSSAALTSGSPTQSDPNNGHSSGHFLIQLYILLCVACSLL